MIDSKIKLWQLEPPDVYATHAYCLNYDYCKNILTVNELTDNDGLCKYCREEVNEQEEGI